MPSLTFDSEESAPTPSRSLCYEGGTRIIALTGDSRYHLILHSEILEKASPFFKAGAKEPWAHDARTVKDPNTGADIKVLTYHLALNEDDKTIVLTQRAPAAGNRLSDIVLGSKVRRFYLSENASGFLPRSGFDGEPMLEPGTEAEESLQYLIDVQRNHEEIFMLLYGEEVETTTWASDGYHYVAEKMAYAEFYQMANLLVPKLRELLLSIPDLWEDIEENYLFHLALAQKLQCSETFEDAMRHYIGNGIDLSYLVSRLSLDPAIAFRIAIKRDELNQRINTFASDAHALYLPTHVYKGDPLNKNAIPKVLKTMSTKFDGGVVTSASTARSIASQIFGQWLSHHQAGDAYWLHRRQRNDSDLPQPRDLESNLLNPGSLRQACNLAVHATHYGTEADLFKAEVIDHFVQQSDLATKGENDHASVLEIEKELTAFVNQLATLAMPLIAPPSFEPAYFPRDHIHYDYHIDQDPIDEDHGWSGEVTRWDDEWDHEWDSQFSPARDHNHGRGRGDGISRGRGGHGGRAHQRGAAVELRNAKQVDVGWGEPSYCYKTARDDTRARYFTCTDPSLEDIVPWKSIPDKSYKISGVEPASEAWLKALGVSRNDEN